MPVVDEEGQLFGVVNVVDALVVLLVVAVGVAGVALVTGGPSGNPETRHVTLDFGTQPDYVVEQIETGDTATFRNGAENLTITDTYLTTTGEEPRALARVEVTAEVVEGTFLAGGDPVRLGHTVAFETDTYIVNGTVRAVGNATELPVEERTVVLRGSVPDDVARTVEAGDRIRTGGKTIASIEDVKAYDADAPNRRTLYVVADLQTLANGGGVTFGDTPVETGRTLSLPLAGYQFDGTVDRVGGGLDRQTENVVVTSVVDADVASRLAEGDTHTASGQDIATVENVAVYGTGDPDRKRVYVGLSVEAVGYGDTLQIGANRSLRTGGSIPFRTSAYEFDGEIVRVGTLARPGEPAERTVTLRMENAPPDRADSVEAGLTETNAGQTVARVTDVRVEPAVVTLTSEDGNIYEREHPVNKDVTLTVELRVRERESGVRFKGRPLQEGNDVVLDLGTTTVRATVVDLDEG